MTDDAGLNSVASLVHDLRSPLSAVLGFARLAREDLAAGDMARAGILLERIERSAAMLEAVLQSVVEPNATRRVSDLRSVVAQVRTERKRDLERREIQLTGPGEAPALAVAQGDLYRLVGNLVGNAIDHMGDADGASIEVAVACQGDTALLRVRDNGVGIAREDRERVFDVAHTHCRREGAQSHCGLGLAIVRELAASWGGRAWIDSSAPGATFCVTIPVAR